MNNENDNQNQYQNQYQNQNKKIQIDIKSLRKSVKEESNFNVDKLLKAIDNDNNESILSLDKSKIKTIKNDILQQLNLPREILLDFHKKLKDYRYVTDLADLRYGSYIRWIQLSDPTNIKMTNGAIFVDIKFLKEGVNIVCKKIGNRVFQIKYDNCLIFQRITDEEQILLDIMNHLQN